MAQVPIEVVDLRNYQTGDVSTAIHALNTTQSEFLYEELAEPLTDQLRLHVLSDTHIGTFLDDVEMKREQWRGFHPYIVCFVDTALHSDEWSNLFSAVSPRGTAVITVDNVEDVLIASEKMPAYLAYEMSIHALHFTVPGRERHKESTACVYDFHEDKRTILDTIASIRICDDCRKWLLENGRALSAGQLVAITRMLERSRSLLLDAEIEARVKPRIFVGSSNEGLEIARSIQAELRYDYSVEVWNQETVFGLGSATIEALEKAVDQYDFGIFVFTPDDQVVERDEEIYIARDNVLFELGLFIGKLSRFSAFIVRPRYSNLRLPSDLNGMTIASYDPDAPNLAASVGPACQQIRNAVRAVQSQLKT